MLSVQTKAFMDRDTEIVPFFPLSVFLFPGEDLPLRIFEPRYRQLIEDARSTGISFVIPFVSKKQVREFGCEVRLKEVIAESPGGRMVITVVALSVVQIVSMSNRLEGKLYSGGAIRRIQCTEPVESQELICLIGNYARQYNIRDLDLSVRPGLTRLDVMKALNLSSEEKYRFISMHDGNRREDYLAGQLRYLELIRNQEMLLGNDYSVN